MIRLLNQDDYKSWLELAKEVEALFGPMADSPEFQQAIKECIGNGNAYGVENVNGQLVGILALDSEKNEISWLAVSKKFRGHNYGNRLVEKVINELSPSGDIFVQTFGDKNGNGKAARAIYERHGFVYLKDAGKNPAGVETIIMVKRKIPKTN